MNREQRIEPREQATLALHLANGNDAVSHNISPSGVYFETDKEQQLGSLIDFEIEFDTPGGPMKFKAQGHIVRINPQGDRTGVGVKLLSNRLEAVG